MPLEHSPLQSTSGDGPSNERTRNFSPQPIFHQPSLAAASTNVQKLSPFWAEQPKLWFVQVESVFSLSRITRDETKYAHVIAISEEVKLKKLLGGLILGDQKPTHFLQSMKALAAGNEIGDNVLKTLFMDQLPENVRSILATSNVELSELAKQADKIIEISQPQVASVSLNENIINQLTAKIDALDHKFNQVVRSRHNSRERNSFRIGENRQDKHNKREPRSRKIVLNAFVIRNGNYMLQYIGLEDTPTLNNAGINFQYNRVD